MNERIRELYIQAINDTRHEPADDINVQIAEKFAELIVKECAEVCYKLAEDSDSYAVHDGDTCAEQIKEHFGVEE